jgi:N-acetylmuramoyl-L-alanine amidase
MVDKELDQLHFPLDLSISAQKTFPARVIIHPTCNFSIENRPRAIVLHYTEGDLESTISTFQRPHNSSAHYIIDRDGSVVQLVPEELAAFHVTCCGNRSLCIPSCPICNGADGQFMEPRTLSIGIELVNQGHINPQFFTGDIFEDYSMSFGYRYWEDFPVAQIKSLQILVEDIRLRWNIPWGMVIGHSRINTNTDPGPALNLFGSRNGDPMRGPIFDQTIQNSN